MFIYQIDVLQELKKAGYTTFRIRQEKRLSEATLQKIRNNEIIGIKSLDAICDMLGKQPNYIIKHVKDWNMEPPPRGFFFVSRTSGNAPRWKRQILRPLDRIRHAAQFQTVSRSGKGKILCYDKILMFLLDNSKIYMLWSGCQTGNTAEKGNRGKDRKFDWTLTSEKSKTQRNTSVFLVSQTQ